MPNEFDLNYLSKKGLRITLEIVALENTLVGNFKLIR